MMLIAIAAFAAFATSEAHAVPLGTPLGGPITVTGTEGRDVFQVTLPINDPRIVVFPAATVSGMSGTCPPNTDPLTGRPTLTECPAAAEPHLLTGDLRGGDDQVLFDGRSALVSSLRINAGGGNDTVTGLTDFKDRTLNGDDGNDLLVAAGQLSTTPADNRPVVFNGGAGTDTAGWDAHVLGVGGSALMVGVSASLVTGTGTFIAPGPSNQPTTYRTDTLTSVEGLSGTPVGDVLTGSTGANTLLGNAGNDNLNGSDGPDSVQGGDGLDDLVGGKDADSLDGGLGIDTYPAGGGGDTFNTRDGFREQVTCVKGDVITNDLVDTVLNNTAANACAVSTAAAKHRYDTKLSGKPARLADGALLTKVRCPAQKPEACEGEVEALLGKRTLARGDYEVKPGKRLALALPISNANARRADGKRIVLAASEIDADGRDRFVSRPVRVR
jgi:Ca2+-binding RTX toxin-like protein